MKSKHTPVNVDINAAFASLLETSNDETYVAMYVDGKVLQRARQIEVNQRLNNLSSATKSRRMSTKKRT